MDLQTFIAEPEARRKLAAACNTSPDYLWQVATGWRNRKASPELARKISEATGGEVTLTELRPDVWPAADQAA